MTVPYYVNEPQSDIRAIKSWMEQWQALVRTVFNPGELPHRNHSREEQFSRIALVANPANGRATS